jgi:D-lyxose ketol-isomerase
MKLQEQLSRMKSMMGIIKENDATELIQDMVDEVLESLRKYANDADDLEDITTIRVINSIDKIQVTDFTANKFEPDIHIVIYQNSDITDYDMVIDEIYSRLNNIIPNLSIQIDDIINSETGQSVYEF